MQTRRSESRRRLAWIAIGVLGLAAVGLWVTQRRLTAYSESPYPVARAIPFHQAHGLLSSSVAPDAQVPVELTFAPAETLGGVLADLGLEPAEANALLEELSAWVDPRRIRPGDNYAVTFGPEDEVRSFEMVVAKSGRARVDHTEAGWAGSWTPFRRSVKAATVAGTLEGALESSIERAGGPAALAVLMADVFQWDLDFTRDLRVDDSFRILYTVNYLDGRRDSLGEIVAVAYDNAGRRLEAYRFGEDGAYYDAEGRPLRKMFLRSPLRYSRITSRFSNRRFHPILKRYRPHYGVDYGAPKGTPVRVTANGVVVSAGWDRGGGKTVKVRHPNGYLTAYLHLSGYAKGIRSGARVAQGEVIGYVGSTGLSTASHLDYRVQRDGRWINPLSLKSVPSDPVPQDRLPEFLAQRERMRSSLFEDGPVDFGDLEGVAVAALNREVQPAPQSGSR